MLGLCSCVISSAFFSIYFSSLRGESVTDFRCVPVLKHRTFPDVVSPDSFPRSRLSPSQRTGSARHWPDWRASWPRVFKSLVRCGLTIRSNGLPDRSRFQTTVRGRQPLNSGVRPFFFGSAFRLLRSTQAAIFRFGCRFYLPVLVRQLFAQTESLFLVSLLASAKRWQGS